MRALLLSLLLLDRHWHGRHCGKTARNSDRHRKTLGRGCGGAETVGKGGEGGLISAETQLSCTHYSAC